ncbi:mitochondrial carrier [Thozetella sp. PMI_491]|nr:mitochondrial carrier [Thozetella sp. PMI_491]
MTRSDARGSDPSGVYPGVLPVIPGDTTLPEKPPGSSAATGATAASARALTSQAIAFYFRAPVKAFFRTRVDYLAYARAIQDQQIALRQAPLGQTSAGVAAAQLPLSGPASGSWPARTWHWLRPWLRRTTPGVLASAVRHYGWRVVPDHVMPPLLANVGVGVVLYTSYLQILAQLHEESGRASKRVYPPPQLLETFTAGFLAGSIQSVVAAPLDAVQARYDLGSSAVGMTGSGNPVTTTGGAASGFERPKSMWSFANAKLREIGVRGIFAGWGLSFLKDSAGSAIFFSTFEYIKAQSYYRFITWYYGALSDDTILLLSQKRPAKKGDGLSATDAPGMPKVIRPHYAIEPAFLMLAGISASMAQQAVLHPLSHIQVEHWERLEMLDAQARSVRQRNSCAPRSQRRWGMLRAYYNAYKETWSQCRAEAAAAGLTMKRWLYRGFWWNTIRQVPSTSAGLIIFEVVRRKYGGGDEIRINRDGYDILLN